jgi:hypothetical protein
MCLNITQHIVISITKFLINTEKCVVCAWADCLNVLIKVLCGGPAPHPSQKHIHAKRPGVTIMSLG